MDDDTLRRGRPTLHVVHGEGMAILAGDGLLTEAFALLAREPADRRRSLVARKLRDARAIADAAGAAGMVGGQAIDLRRPARAARRPEAPLPSTPLREHARAQDRRADPRVGGGRRHHGRRPDDAGARPSTATARELGLAFQIVDDILDVEGATEDLGKTAGKDAAAGKPTYPALFGLDVDARAEARGRTDALERGPGASRLDESRAGLGRSLLAWTSAVRRGSSLPAAELSCRDTAQGRGSTRCSSSAGSRRRASGRAR